MNTPARALTASLLALLALAACSTKRIPGTEIEDNDETRAVLDVVSAYKRAFEARDAKGVLALVSPRFFETVGTPEPSDDYDRAGLERNLEHQFGQVTSPGLDLDVRRVEIDEEKHQARVNYFYSSRWQRTDGGAQQGFQGTADIAQIRLVKEDGAWKIVGGI